MSHYDLTYEHNGVIEHETYVADNKAKAIDQFEHDVWEGELPPDSKYIDCHKNTRIH